jgi:hypothetical protein
VAGQRQLSGKRRVFGANGAGKTRHAYSKNEAKHITHHVKYEFKMDVFPNIKP